MLLKLYIVSRWAWRWVLGAQFLCVKGKACLLPCGSMCSSNLSILLSRGRVAGKVQGGHSRLLSVLLLALQRVRALWLRRVGKKSFCPSLFCLWLTSEWLVVVSCLRRKLSVEVTSRGSQCSSASRVSHLCSVGRPRLRLCVRHVLKRDYGSQTR